MSRVLVTGATGFIGRGTLAPLLEAGMEVHAVSSKPAPNDSPVGVQWHQVDLLAPGAERELASVGASHLLHLAWYAEPGRFWRAAENLDWVAASLRLLRAFSCAEYEWVDETHCSETLTPTRPATLYGTAKHSLHAIAQSYASEVGLSLAWGRVFFVFGPHEHPARLAGSVASALVAGREAPCSHGEQVRDFLYAPELASAFVTLLRSPVTGAVNLASGRPARVRDLIEAIAEAAGRPDLVRLGARPSAPEPLSLTADVGRLRDEVGWSPSLSMSEAAQLTVDWWRGHAG
ncbi:MAG: NAD-dependent epimerase/dehydratase family protein [Solirubrobacteraceae bacterium]